MQLSWLECDNKSSEPSAVMKSNFVNWHREVDEANYFDEIKPRPWSLAVIIVKNSAQSPRKIQIRISDKIYIQSVSKDD